MAQAKISGLNFRWRLEPEPGSKEWENGCERTANSNCFSLLGEKCIAEANAGKRTSLSMTPPGVTGCQEKADHKRKLNFSPPSPPLQRPGGHLEAAFDCQVHVPLTTFPAQPLTMLLNRMKALPPSEYLRFQCDPQQKSRGSSQHKRIKWCLQHVDTISQISWPRSANCSWYDTPRALHGALLRLRIRLYSTTVMFFQSKGGKT